MKLALRPLLYYYWSRDQVFKFYGAAVVAPVNIVHSGEVVCSRRHESRVADWLELVQRLTAAAKMPFVGSLYLNIYNPQTIALLAAFDAPRWGMPVELSRGSLRTLQQQRPAAIATEVFADGCLSFALSACCFTARRYNLPRDSYEFRCIDYQNGMSLPTGEGQPFLTLNGIQTQSAQTYNLIRELDELLHLDVNVLRISPQSADTFTIFELFRQCLDRAIAQGVATRRTESLMPIAPCNGYWHRQLGFEQVVASTPSGEA